MAVFKVTKADCTRIIALPKEIDQNIKWSLKGNDDWAEAALAVKCQYPGSLELRLTANTQILWKYSMTLILNQAYTVKRLDVNGSHSNKCTDKKVWICETHKHDWSEACPDGHAYTPNDIHGTTIETVLKEFCHECNIVFNGNFKPVPMKPKMTGV